MYFGLQCDILYMRNVDFYLIYAYLLWFKNKELAPFYGYKLYFNSHIVFTFSYLEVESGLLHGTTLQLT